MKCGAPLCPECERPFNGRPYCAACLKSRGGEAGSAPVKQASEVSKKTKEKRPRPKLRISKESVRSAFAALGGSSGAGPALASNRLPKEVRRVIARSIDIAVVISFSIPFSWILRLITFQWMSDVGGIGFALSLYFAALFTGSVYFIYSEWRYGKTLGKWLLGLRVTRYGGGRLPFFSSVWRWVGFLTGCIWACIGWWLMTRLMTLIKVFEAKLPPLVVWSGAFFAVMGVIMFSLGLLITFVGKYKRGFHDLIGESIVSIDSPEERGKASASKT